MSQTPDWVMELPQSVSGWLERIMDDGSVWGRFRDCIAAELPYYLSATACASYTAEDLNVLGRLLPADAEVLSESPNGYLTMSQGLHRQSMVSRRPNRRFLMLPFLNKGRQRLGSRDLLFRPLRVIWATPNVSLLVHAAVPVGSKARWNTLTPQERYWDDGSDIVPYLSAPSAALTGDEHRGPRTAPSG